MKKISFMFFVTSMFYSLFCSEKDGVTPNVITEDFTGDFDWYEEKISAEVTKHHPWMLSSLAPLPWWSRLKGF